MIKLEFCTNGCGSLLRGEKIEYNTTLSSFNDYFNYDLFLKYKNICKNRNSLNNCECLNEKSKYIAYTTWVLNYKDIEVKELKENSILNEDIYSNNIYMFERKGSYYGVLFSDIYLDKYNRYLSESAPNDKGFGFKLYWLNTNNAWWVLNYQGIIEYTSLNNKEFFTKNNFCWDKK